MRNDNKLFLKNLFRGFLLVGFIFFFYGCNLENNNSEHITVLSEEYAPLNFMQEGKVTGLVSEVVNAIANKTRNEITLDILPWNEGYNRIQSEPNTALITTVMTQERKDLFQWVGPVAVLETSFYVLSDSNIEIKTLEEAKNVNAIATVTGHYTEQVLKEEGFTNLVSCANDEVALQKLLEQDVSLYISSNVAMPALLSDAHLQTNEVKKIFSVSLDLAYIAFSQTTSPDIITRWQSALDEIKRKGEFDVIYAKWLPEEMPPGIFQLMTEEYPPITFMKDGKPSGFVTEMVQEIAKRLHIPDNVRLTTWKNAYNMALINPNVILFSAERTPAREALFQWVGPVGKNSADFYAKKGSNITLNSLEEAKSLEKIATTTGWFTETYLQDNNFSNLVSFASPQVSVTKLINGDVNLSIFTNLTVADIVAEANSNMNDIEAVYEVLQTYFYIALSKETSNNVYQQWNTALKEMKEDGTFEAIYRSYLPDAKLDGLLEP